MSLAQQTLRLVKYPPETLVESRFLATIGGNATVVHFELTSIDPFLVWVREIGMNRNASLEARVDGTVAGTRYENILPFGAAVQPLDDSVPIDSPFDYETFFRITNLTGIAVANYQARVLYEVQKYTVADKLALGVSSAAMTSQELTLADKYLVKDKVRTGELPMAYPKGALQTTHIGQWAGNPAANTENTLIERSVPEDCKVVLSGLWCSQPAANFGNLEIRIYRERQLFLTVFPYEMANYTTATRWIKPLSLWIPALSNLRVILISTTGHVGILAEAQVETRKLTIWDKLAWGVALSSEEKELVSRLNLDEKLAVGQYELYTPIVQG